MDLLIAFFDRVSSNYFTPIFLSLPGSFTKLSTTIVDAAIIRNLN